MENLSYRDGLLVGDSARRSFQNPRLPSPKGACRASDVDFSDVFGGPPRCASLEVRRSLGEVFSDRNEEGVQLQPARYTSPWAAALGEQPVFGEGSPCRREHLAVDFFDDIFNGEDSLSSSTRQSSEVSRLPTSVPGSFVPSPVHPSMPRQLSLSKISRKLDYLAGSAPPSSSPNRSQKGATNTSPWPSSQNSSESQVTLGRDDYRDGFRLSHGRSPLSNKNFITSETSSEAVDTVGRDSGSQCPRDQVVPQKLKENDQFHFSIYKWANKGVPLNNAFRGGYRRSSNLVDMQNGTSTGSAAPVLKGAESPSLEKSVSLKAPSMVQSGGQETGSVNASITNKGLPPEPVAETLYSRFGRNDVKDADARDSSSTKGGALNKPKRDAFVESEEKIKTAQQGWEKKGNLQNSEYGPAMDNAMHQEKKIGKNIHCCENETILLSQDAPVVAGDMLGRKVKGKVQQFVKMFSQEAPSKPAHNRESKAPKLKKNPSRRSKAEEESNDVNRTFRQPQQSFFVNKEPFRESFDTTVECIEVEDITEDQLMQNPMNQHQEEIHILDAKIRKWSSGKEGNIRSLLSTLQYVLWPESGWKPVALVDIIEGASVKRAYQKALLCLHPDKLQQKGASTQQKYTAEKVFDVLQDAWTHFNLISSL